MMSEENLVSFWDGEVCEYCGGPIVEKSVTVHREADGKYLIFEDVPAGVCRECGTRYYAANILKQMEERVRGRQQATREELVPVYTL